MANEYLVKGESLTAVADKIRILNGTTEGMDLEEMATNVGAANSEVDSQTELLAQAVAALEGKAGVGSGGSSGGGSASLETCTVTVNAEGPGTDYLCATTMNNGQLGAYVFNGRGSDSENTLAIENVVCGSTIGLCATVAAPMVSFSNGGELIDYGNSYFTLKAPTEAGVSTTVNIYTDPDW